MYGWGNYNYVPEEISEENAGRYYCGCRYVSETSHCVHHGDPVEHFPKPPKDDR